MSEFQGRTRRSRLARAVERQEDEKKDTSGRKSKPRRKKRSVLRLLMIFVIIPFLIGLTIVLYLGFQINQLTTSAYSELDRGDHSLLRNGPVNPMNEGFSVLFLGVDNLDGNLNGRTDSIMYATFSPDDRSVKMVSIPRDSYVTIPGRGEDKINHAHAFGGPDLTIATVEELFELPVDYFATVNFQAFMEIVDALGGVEIDVEFSFSESNSTNRGEDIYIEEGEQVLGGEEALAYARMRYHDPLGDIGRGNRQKEVLQAILRKGVSPRGVLGFNGVIDSLETHMISNVETSDIAKMYQYPLDLGEIETLTIEATELRQNGISYQSLDENSLAEVKSEFKAHLGL